jgi:hypothetical protein
VVGVGHDDQRRQVGSHPRDVVAQGIVRVDSDQQRVDARALRTRDASVVSAHRCSSNGP